MELGNIIFGNSRGNYCLPDRDLVNCKEWNNLTDIVCGEGDYHGFAKDGLPSGDSGGFYNEVFAINPYYWGDCTCGFDDEEFDWSENHKHKSDCYQSWVKNELKNRGLEHASISDEQLVYKYACKKFGFDFNSGGYGCHCTCGLDDEYEKWRENHDHKEGCLLMRHNFIYKPTGFWIDWYKYPFRDSYMSDDLTKEQLKEIWEKCIESVKGYIK
jgi:hypothetical protein